MRVACGRCAPRLDVGRELAVFLLAGVALGPLVETLTGPPFARLASDVDPYLATATRWWTGDALWCLIVGGLLLAWFGCGAGRIACAIRARPAGTGVGPAGRGGRSFRREPWGS
jgi:hypothetical protein